MPRRSFGSSINESSSKAFPFAVHGVTFMIMCPSSEPYKIIEDALRDGCLVFVLVIPCGIFSAISSAENQFKIGILSYD